MLVPLDRGPCVSSRRFAHFFLKCAPLPHKTISPQSVSFVVVPFLETPVDDSPFSRLPTFSSFLCRAQTSDPYRGFGPLLPTLTSASFRPGLRSATPVEDSVISPFQTLPYFSRAAEVSDPCRGMGPSPSRRTSASFRPGLQFATPVEDSALPL